MNKILINKRLLHKKPFFSVVTVVKNSDRYIEKTIRSVVSQSFKDFEYIVIDGNSTDLTLRRIKTFKNKINILISEKDNGIYDAMNKGIKLSRGNVLVFINSGDTFTKKALQIISQIFKKDKTIDFVFGTVIRNYTKAKILKYGFNKNRLLYNFDFATSHTVGFFLKRKIYNLVGRFNTSYRCSADYDIYLKVIMKRNLKGSSTSKNELIGNVAAGGFSSKISFFDHLKEEILIRKNNKQNKVFLLIIFINALIKHFFKKII